MSKEQLREEFDNQINNHDDFWISEKAFDWFYSKLQEKDRIQFNALLKWHEERHKLKAELKTWKEESERQWLKIKNSQIKEHKLTANASEFLDEYRAMKKQLAKEKELRQAAEKVIKALTDRIMPQEYQKLKI